MNRLKYHRTAFFVFLGYSSAGYVLLKRIFNTWSSCRFPSLSFTSPPPLRWHFSLLFSMSHLDCLDILSAHASPDADQRLLTISSFMLGQVCHMFPKRSLCFRHRGSLFYSSPFSVTSRVFIVRSSPARPLFGNRGTATVDSRHISHTWYCSAFVNHRWISCPIHVLSVLCPIPRRLSLVNSKTALPLPPRKRARGRGVLPASVRHRQHLQCRALLHPSGKRKNNLDVFFEVLYALRVNDAGLK